MYNLHGTEPGPNFPSGQPAFVSTGMVKKAVAMVVAVTVTVTMNETMTALVTPVPVMSMAVTVNTGCQRYLNSVEFVYASVFFCSVGAT